MRAEHHDFLCADGSFFYGFNVPDGLGATIERFSGGDGNWLAPGGVAHGVKLCLNPLGGGFELCRVVAVAFTDFLREMRHGAAQFHCESFSFHAEVIRSEIGFVNLSVSTSKGIFEKACGPAAAGGAVWVYHACEYSKAWRKPCIDKSNAGIEQVNPGKGERRFAPSLIRRDGDGRCPRFGRPRWRW